MPGPTGRAAGVWVSCQDTRLCVLPSALTHSTALTKSPSTPCGLWHSLLTKYESFWYQFPLGNQRCNLLHHVFLPILSFAICSPLLYWSCALKIIESRLNLFCFFFLKKKVWKAMDTKTASFRKQKHPWGLLGKVRLRGERSVKDTKTSTSFHRGPRLTLGLQTKE